MNLLLFIELTSRLDVAVADDLMTSHATWLDIIAECEQYRQELEREEHRYMACTTELLSAAVRDVFQVRRATSNSDEHDKNDSNDDDAAAAAAAAAADDDDDRYTEEYNQILE